MSAYTIRPVLNPEAYVILINTFEIAFVCRKGWLLVLPQWTTGGLLEIGVRSPREIAHRR
jgi:hypothetical protein